MKSQTWPESKYEDFKALSQQSWFQILILMTFCLLLFLVGVGRWDLWDPDEPRYAQVAKEMVTNSGDWFLMHLNGKVYGDKPPLFFWLIALSSYVWGGFTSFAVRFPPALFATFTVLLTYFLGKSLYSSRVGLLSGLILATSMEFIYLATRANIDTTLTFFTTASILCFVQWVQGKREKKTETRMDGPRFFAFYAAMALGTLAKGPLGFILPLLVCLIFLALQRNWKGMKEMRLLPGMLLFFVIVLSWYLPAVISGGKAYLLETLFKHTVDAYAKGWTHVHPFYFYFLNFPANFLPWMLFLPGALVFILSRRDQGMERASLFLLVWFISIFLFFSFSKGKRELYLLPLYPAVSLVVGKFWDSYISGSTPAMRRKRWITLPIYLLAALLFLMGIVLYIIPVVAGFSLSAGAPHWIASILKGARRAADYLSYVPFKSYGPFIFLLPVSAALLGLAQRLRRRALVFLLIVMSTGIGFFYGTRFIFPMIDPYKSARFLSTEIKEKMRPGDTLAMYGGFAVGPYNFYTDIIPIVDIKDMREMADFFRSSDRKLCLIQNHEYEALKKTESALPMYLIARRKVGSKDILLVANQ